MTASASTASANTNDVTEEDASELQFPKGQLFIIYIISMLIVFFILRRVHFNVV